MLLMLSIHHPSLRRVPLGPDLFIPFFRQHQFLLDPPMDGCSHLGHVYAFENVRVCVSRWGETELSSKDDLGRGGRLM